MKIQKFKESNNYEWNLNKLKIFLDKNIDLLKNIYKYLEWQKPKNEQIWFKDLQYYFDSDDILVISYFDDWEGTEGTIRIGSDKMNEFLLFINNPDLFLKSEKYNI